MSDVASKSKSETVLKTVGLILSRTMAPSVGVPCRQATKTRRSIGCSVDCIMVDITIFFWLWVVEDATVFAKDLFHTKKNTEWSHYLNP